nr:uncharacterized protein LOC111138279 isoform X3 [Crassostrea virginica]
MNAIEMTVLTTDVFDITLGVEGGEYYKCQSDINYKQELEDELSATKGLNRSCTDGSNFKEQLHLTATILSTLLSLVLTGVILYLLQRKNKQISLKTRSQLDPSSRRSLDNDYESLHDNMDAAV